MGARLAPNPTSGIDVRFSALSTYDFKSIRTLALEMRRLPRRRNRVNKPSQWYVNPDWYWIADRVAAALNTLADHLERFTELRRQKHRNRPAVPTAVPNSSDERVAALEQDEEADEDEAVWILSSQTLEVT